MGFSDAVKSGFNKYFDFSSRASRSEYWFWALFVLITAFVLGFIDGLFGMMTPTGLGVLGTIFTLVTFIPGIALGVRRLHDRDMSGFWLLLCLIPLLGSIALLVIFCMKGTDGDNRFGPDPLAVPEVVT